MPSGPDPKYTLGGEFILEGEVYYIHKATSFFGWNYVLVPKGEAFMEGHWFSASEAFLDGLKRPWGPKFKVGDVVKCENTHVGFVIRCPNAEGYDYTMSYYRHAANIGGNDFWYASEAVLVKP